MKANDDRLKFHLLGPVGASRDGEPVALGGPRQRALLALLLLQPGRTVPVDELVDAIWAGEPPDGASGTIRSYVSKLRSALGPGAPILGTTAGYAIDVRRETIDVVNFDRLIRDSDDAMRQGDVREASEQIARAMMLWRGRPFGELGQDGPLRVEADRLEERRLHAVEQKLEAELNLGRAVGLVDELEAAVAQHPYRERLWRLLMLALYHSGRQADALAAYHRARQMLDEQLGIDPSAELQALEGEILRQEVVPLARMERIDNLPSPHTSFVGRELELEEITQVLSQSRLVTLTGVGGVGKTRLAIEVARRSRAAPDGTVFVDLAPVADDDAVAWTVVRTLDLREQGAVAPTDLVATDLRRAHVIVLLDNCEHVRKGAAEFADALRARCPGVRVLATSRIPLGSPGEVDIPVAPLRVPPEPASADDLRRSDAVRLLVVRADASRPRTTFDDRSLAEAARICRDLDGLPLAIELAAARAKVMTLQEIAGRLDDRFRFLVSWRRVSPARHQTLKQAIDWSFDLLSPEDQAVFATLAVFASGFTLDAVAGVCTKGDEMLAVDAVTRLVDASLVVLDPAEGRTRYRMLETVRQYAEAQLSERGHLGAARDAHAGYFRSLAERAEPELSGADQAAWLARLDAEHANFVAALDHMAGTGRDAQALLEFTVALTRFWYVRGHLSEARVALARALGGSASAPTLLRRRGLTAAASIALLQGDHAEATRLAEASLAAARESGEDRLVANGLSNLGAILLASGEHMRALTLLGEAVALARKVGDTRVLALALNNLGDHALTVGDYVSAEPLFVESLRLLEARGDTANVARSLFNLGAVALKTDRVAEAEARLRDSLSASREAGDQEDLCWGLLGLAAVSAARAEGDKAAVLLGAATSLLRGMGAAFKPFERQLHDETERRVLDLLGRDTYEQARVRGASLPLTDAFEIAQA